MAKCPRTVLIPPMSGHICKASRGCTLSSFRSSRVKEADYTCTFPVLPMSHSSIFRTWIKSTVSANLPTNLFSRSMARRWNNPTRKRDIFVNPMLSSCPPLTSEFVTYPMAFLRPLPRNQRRASTGEASVLPSSSRSRRTGHQTTQDPPEGPFPLLITTTSSPLRPTSICP